MSRIVATLGRKLWYYPNGSQSDGFMTGMDETTPYDATVIYPWPVGADGKTQLLNLFVIDHVGTTSAKSSVPLIQEDDAKPTTGGYAQWMPYQVSSQAPASLTPTPSPDTTASAAPVSAPSVAVTPASSDASAPSDTTQNQQAADPSQVLSNAAQSTSDATAAAATPALSNSQIIYASNFAGALAAIQAGLKVARSGWNGKGMFVYLVPAASYAAQTGVAKAYFGENAMVPYSAYLAIKNVDNTVSTWVPSVNDVLANDWTVVV